MTEGISEGKPGLEIVAVVVPCTEIVTEGCPEGKPGLGIVTVVAPGAGIVNNGIDGTAMFSVGSPPGRGTVTVANPCKLGTGSSRGVTRSSVALCRF